MFEAIRFIYWVLAAAYSAFHPFLLDSFRCEVQGKGSMLRHVHQGSPLSAVLKPGWASRPLPPLRAQSVPPFCPSAFRKRPPALSSHPVPFYSTVPFVFLFLCFNPGPRRSQIQARAPIQVIAPPFLPPTPQGVLLQASQTITLAYLLGPYYLLLQVVTMSCSPLEGFQEGQVRWGSTS